VSISVSFSYVNKHTVSKAKGLVQDCSGDRLVLFYNPMTAPATDQQMNRMTVRAMIFKLMNRAVLSFMILGLQYRTKLDAYLLRDRQSRVITRDCLSYRPQ
jgi:hypothetical protein